MKGQGSTTKSIKRKYGVWNKRNPEKIRERARRRRASKARAPGIFTTEDERRLYKLYDRCLCCGTAEDLTTDHVIPLVKGGANSLENCQVLCRSCNSKKYTKTIDYRPAGEG